MLEGSAVRGHVDLLRSAAAGLGTASSMDEIARSALTTALGIPGVVRAGIALNRLGGRQLEFVTTDEERFGPSLRWCLIDAFDRLPLNDAVRTGRDVLLGSPEDLEAAYPEMAPSQLRRGTRALAALALSTGSERLGALLLCFDADQRFGAEDRWLLTSFAAQVTQGLRRDRAQQARWMTAEDLQRSLMLSALPVSAGLSLSARYQPGGLNSDVGGDWYDVFEVPDGSTALVVGDVMGKGADAAVLMGEVRTALRAYALVDARPSAVLGMLDRYVSARIPDDHLVTAVLGLVDPGRERLTWSVAGHPPPLLVPPQDPPRALDGPLGPALGLGGGGAWSDATTSLRPHDTVFLFSDGLVNGRAEDIFTAMTRLGERIAGLPPGRRRPRDLCSEAASAMAGVDRADDVTMLALQCVPEGTLHRCAMPLAPDPRAAGLARGLVRRQLADWGLAEDTVETAVLGVSELVTNAVLHGGSTIQVVVEMDRDTVTVVVEDRGGRGEVDRTAPEDPTRVSGRGLTLVAALSSSWDVQQTADVTTVWFDLDLSRDPETARDQERA